MKNEQIILYIIYSCTFISLAFIPKRKWKDASIIFLFQQFVTWFLGLLVVEMHLLEYPVRELSEVNRTSFLFEFLFFPIVSIFYCIYYPKTSNILKKILYTSTFSTGLTIPEFILEKYTNLISYLKWEWYITWFTVYACLYLSWRFYKWYFRLV